MIEAHISDTSKRRFDIEEKLQEDIEALESLKEMEENSKKLTKGMVDILNSIEDRLATLRKTILPVYNETINLQKQQHSKVFFSNAQPNIKYNFVIYRHRESSNGIRSCNWLLWSLPRSRGFYTGRTKWSRWLG